MKQRKVDLHIHTPASGDYRGKKENKEYYEILKKCNKDNISTIAITDHNTIKGYAKFLELKQSTEIGLNHAVSMEAPQDYIDSLRENLLFFSNINLIPGVELSVYPKLHIILLFDESVPLVEIDQFLKVECSLGDASETGDPKSVINKTPIELINIASKKFGGNVYCILPHIDSSSGAWRELTGTSRIELLSHPNVTCCQVLNLDTIHEITNVSKNKEYSNIGRMAFIQASDFHGAEGSRPGAQCSYFESEKRIIFKELISLLTNTKPVLSSSKVEEQYNDFTKNLEIIQINLHNNIEFGSKEFEEEASKQVCGFFNSDNTILQVNLFNTQEDYADAVNQLMELIKNRIIVNLDPPLLPARLSVLDFSYSSTKKRIIIEILKRLRLYQFNNEIVVKSGDICKPATSSEVEAIVVRNSYNRFFKRKELFLSQRAHDIAIASKSFYSQSILSKINDRLSKPNFGNISGAFSYPSPSNELRDIFHAANGVANGNCYYIDKSKGLGGRLDKESYLRLSCPQYQSPTNFNNTGTENKVPENSIIIVAGKGVYYAKESKELYSETPCITFSLDEKDLEEHTPDIILGLAVYLKSNFALWYALMFYETADFLPLFLGKRSVVKIPKDIAFLKNMSVFGKNLLTEEKEFLKKTHTFGHENTDESCKKYSKLVGAHNNTSAGQLQLMERELINYLKLTKTDVTHIYNTLEDLGYYTYNAIRVVEEIFSK